MHILKMKNIFGACARGELKELLTHYGRPEHVAPYRSTACSISREGAAADSAWYPEPLQHVETRTYHVDRPNERLIASDWNTLRLHPADPGISMQLEDQILSAKFGFGLEPLHIALMYGRADFAGYILKRGRIQQLWAETKIISRRGICFPFCFGNDFSKPAIGLIEARAHCRPWDLPRSGNGSTSPTSPGLGVRCADVCPE